MKKQPDDPNSLIGIPGLGDTSIKALAEQNYTTKKDLIALSNPTELANILGMDRDKAGQVFAFCRKTLADAKLIPNRENTAWELYQIRLGIGRLKTGCLAFDELLGGGFEAGALTEIYGAFGSGKTQTAHTICVTAQTINRDADEEPLIILIDTELSFRPERIIGILKAKKIIMTDEDSKVYLDRILVWKALDPYQQLSHVKDAGGFIKTLEGTKAKVKVIIVDSISAVLRAQFIGRGNIKSKFDLLNEILHKLKNIAETYKIPVVLINQIYNAPEEQFGKDKDIAYGGNILGHTSTYRIKLETVGSGKKHRARIIKSPYQANNEVDFRITKAGLEDLE